MIPDESRGRLSEGGVAVADAEVVLPAWGQPDLSAKTILRVAQATDPICDSSLVGER